MELIQYAWIVFVTWVVMFILIRKVMSLEEDRNNRNHFRVQLGLPELKPIKVRYNIFSWRRK